MRNSKIPFMLAWTLAQGVQATSLCILMPPPHCLPRGRSIPTPVHSGLHPPALGSMLASHMSAHVMPPLSLSLPCQGLYRGAVGSQEPALIGAEVRRGGSHFATSLVFTRVGGPMTHK